MKPVVALPKQFDVRGIVQVALVTSDIHQALIQVGKASFPLVKQYFLQLLNIDMPGEAVADGAYDFPILDRMGRVYGTPQNINMYRLPLSISMRASSDTLMYGLRNINATSPSGGNRGLLLCCFLGGILPAIARASSFCQI